MNFVMSEIVLIECMIVFVMSFFMFVWYEFEISGSTFVVTSVGVAIFSGFILCGELNEEYIVKVMCMCDIIMLFMDIILFLLFVCIGFCFLGFESFFV